MTAADSVRAREADNLLIVEAHAIEDVAQVVGALRRVGKAVVRCEALVRAWLGVGRRCVGAARIETALGPPMLSIATTPARTMRSAQGRDGSHDRCEDANRVLQALRLHSEWCHHRFPVALGLPYEPAECHARRRHRRHVAAAAHRATRIRHSGWAPAGHREQQGPRVASPSRVCHRQNRGGTRRRLGNLERDGGSANARRRGTTERRA